MILRALRARAFRWPRDRVLGGAVIGMLGLTLVVAVGIPAELRAAPLSVRGAFAEEYRVVGVLSAALVAAIYGSFRYTIDHRDGAVAQQVTITQRVPHLVARVPFTMLGGAVIALVAVGASQLVVMLLVGVDEIAAETVFDHTALGTIMGLWGFCLGVIVRRHLLALAVVPASLGIALLLAAFAPEIGVWLPFPAGADALGFELAPFGFTPDSQLPDGIAVVVFAGWLCIATAVAYLRFTRFDVT